MFDTFMFGFVLGIWAVAIPSAIVLRCRFKFHKWLRWQIAADGRSQFRNCGKCNYYAVEIFRDFTVKVMPPPDAGEGEEG